jgi:hypothetical protein
MRRKLPGLFFIAAICALFLMADVGISADPNKPPADGNDCNLSGAEANSDGPTVNLSYKTAESVRNPTSSFMYFVPLVSPTRVEMEIDANNQQESRLVSYERKVTSKSFYVKCEFEMFGKGFFNTTFYPPDVIAMCREGLEKDRSMEHALDYIKFEGEGLGFIEVRGTVSGSTQTVTRVDVHFNAKGRKSPVTIGLYSIDPNNGQYKYENRYNELVARVATLTFKKSEGAPTMGVKLVSVNRAAHPNRLIGRIKGVIANLIIEPPKVSKLGNDTMLNFGLALLKKQPSFTFPKATNVISTDKLQ